MLFYVNLMFCFRRRGGHVVLVCGTACVVRSVVARTLQVLGIASHGDTAGLGEQ